MTQTVPGSVLPHLWHPVYVGQHTLLDLDSTDVALLLF